MHDEKRPLLIGKCDISNDEFDILLYVIRGIEEIFI